MTTTFTRDEVRELTLKGVELIEAGQFGEAEQVLSTITLLNPTERPALTLLGITYSQLNQLHTAEAHFGYALDLDPADPVARCHRGELRLKRGDPAGLDDLREAVRHDPQLRTESAKRARRLLGNR